MSTVRLLRRNRIDDARWDAAVARDPLAAPYGLSWWLDATTRRSWVGVVLDDYRVVLPLFLRVDLRLAALVDGAPFTPHAGPFGSPEEGDLGALLAAVPPRYAVRRLGLYLPPADLTPLLEGRPLHPRPRTNYELDLQPGYRVLAGRYRADLRRKLRDHPPDDLRPWTKEAFVDFYAATVGKRLSFSPTLRRCQLALLTEIERRGAGDVYRCDGADGRPLAGLVLARRGRRIVNLMAASSPAGYRENGMARLLDGVVRRHASTEALLDFEGSDLKGVAEFFRGFGARKVTYLHLHDGRLPGLIS